MYNLKLRPTRTIPKRDAAFIAFNRNMHERRVAKGADRDFTTEELQEFSALTNTSGQAYTASTNRVTRNKETTERKNVAFDALKERLCLVIHELEGNPKVLEEDLRAMGLPSREHHAHEKLRRGLV